jgi:hypothetical protein
MPWAPACPVCRTTVWHAAWHGNFERALPRNLKTGSYLASCLTKRNDFNKSSAFIQEPEAS